MCKGKGNSKSQAAPSVAPRLEGKWTAPQIALGQPKAIRARGLHDVAASTIMSLQHVEESDAGLVVVHAQKVIAARAGRVKVTALH